MGIDERVRQLKKLCEKMPEAMEIYKEQTGEKASELIVRQKTDLFEQTSALEAAFSQLRRIEGNLQHRDTFLETIQKKAGRHGRDYIQVIKHLTSEETTAGTLWLREIVDRITIDFFENLPAFRYHI
jgi:hypothetical protein